MSALLSLSEGYGSFFFGCAKFAVSPYTKTFKSVVDDQKRKGSDLCSSIMVASVMTGLLTFVPVLPAVCAFTFALASIAMLLAAISLPFTYTIAAIADVCTPDSSRDTAFAM